MGQNDDLPEHIKKMLDELESKGIKYGIIDLRKVNQFTLDECEYYHLIFLMKLTDNPGDDTIIHCLLQVGKRLSFLRLKKRSSYDN